MDNEILDKEAPLPYNCRGKDITTTIKFSFDQETTTKETSRTGSGDQATETTRTVVASYQN